MFIRSLLYLIVIMSIVGCESLLKNDLEDKYELLSQLSSDYTGVTFVNDVNESANYNYLTYEGYYQGAGVGVGDFDNDGLQDIFFAGNSSPDQLYRNIGGLKFENVTSDSGVSQDDSWSTGVAVVDINNDNLLDIYVCKFLYDEPSRRKNRLYINRGGMQFIEASDQFGLGDIGYSIHSTFLDYDRDGDLDAFVVNQPPTKNSVRYALGARRDMAFSSKFYENQGDNGFVDKTSEAGLENFGYSLHAQSADFNNDGWMDIYVSNDFEEADFYYVNQKDGTFTDEVSSSFRHISNFSMGADAADVNNDGRMDLMVADMAASDPFRQKTNMASMNPKKFEKMKEDFGIPQYMYNSLQVNQGGNRFSEVAHFAGIAYSDWSWSPLAMDLDLDGWKDLVISNGIIKDVTNKDVLSKRKKLEAEHRSISGSKVASVEMYILSKMPSVKLKNQIFLNKGELSFMNISESSGIEFPTWTQGMAYADLDNDGDLDLVYNNAQQEASIIRNNATGSEFINFKFASRDFKRCPIGTKIKIYHGDTIQMSEINPIRGYQSSCECVANFGLGTRTNIDSAHVFWPDGTALKIGKMNSGKLYNLRQNNTEKKIAQEFIRKDLEFIPLNNHGKQVVYDDYKDEALLPFKLSESKRKPAKSKNGKYVFIPGSKSYPSGIYATSETALKIKQELNPVFEDVHGSFLDFDDDGDEDLCVISSNIEDENAYEKSNVRFYENTGYTWKLVNNVPNVSINGSVVFSEDFNGDGLPDLFVGSRSERGKYGFKPTSFVLLNDGKGGFHMGESKKLGMITDGELFDLDKDGSVELILAIEWGQVEIFNIINGQFIQRTADFNLDSPNGFWQSISVVDLNKDGYLDLLAGNIGLNSKYNASIDEPMILYSGDLDQNGSEDIFLSNYYNGKEVPIRGRQCSSEEMPRISERFQTYESFAVAEISEIIDKSASEESRISSLSSHCYFGGVNGFEEVELPVNFQWSSIASVAPFENGFLVGGNMFNWEAESTQLDANYGLYFEVENSTNILVKNLYDIQLAEIYDIMNLNFEIYLLISNTISDFYIIKK